MASDRQQSDWHRLARRLHERGIRSAEVRRTDDGYRVLSTAGAVSVPERTGQVTAEQWAEAAIDQVIGKARTEPLLHPR